MGQQRHSRAMRSTRILGAVVVVCVFFTYFAATKPDVRRSAPNFSHTQPQSTSRPPARLDADSNEQTKEAKEHEGPVTSPLPAAVEQTAAATLDVAGQSVSRDAVVSSAATGAAPRAAMFDLADFANEVREVEREVAARNPNLRADALNMLGGTAAAAKHFDMAAAAYAMFLNEFGPNHEYSPRVAARLSEFLAPFDPRDVGDAMEWPEGEQPPQHRLRQAVTACELAVHLLEDEGESGRAMLRLGALYRLLGEWDLSTGAWDQCVARLPEQPMTWAAERMAADNFGLQGNFAAAAERYTALAAKFEAGPRQNALRDHAEELQARSRRTAAWLDDPVASFKLELAERGGNRTRQVIFRDVMQWLRGEGRASARREVAEWVGAQADWPADLRIEAICTYSAILAEDHDDVPGDPVAAADAVAAAIALTGEPAQRVPLSIWRARMLNRAGQTGLADNALDALEEEVRGEGPRIVDVLAARVQMLLDRGQFTDAKTAFAALASSFPNSDQVNLLARTFDAQGTESNQ